MHKREAKMLLPCLVFCDDEKKSAAKFGARWPRIDSADSLRSTLHTCCKDTHGLQELLQIVLRLLQNVDDLLIQRIRLQKYLPLKQVEAELLVERQL